MNNQSVMISLNESDVDSVSVLIDSVSFFSERLIRLIQISNS